MAQNVWLCSKPLWHCCGTKMSTLYTVCATSPLRFPPRIRPAHR
jgi:hypothetical protein